MRKRITVQIGTRKQPNVSADVKHMDDAHKYMLDTQIGDSNASSHRRKSRPQKHSFCGPSPGSARALCHVQFQTTFAAARHNPVLKQVAHRVKKSENRTSSPSSPKHVTIASAILKTGITWQANPTAWVQLFNQTGYWE